MNHIYRKLGKRVFDIFLSLFAILLLWPIIVIIAILVRIKLGSPVLFVQERPGKDEKIFKMYKFRTMTNKTDGFGALLPDDKRLTKFGRFLRSTSLDELPELFNVIKGEMSWVGPRPLLIEYLVKYDSNQRHRHDVKPGLTGLAQVRGRNSLKWDEKFKYDLEYVKTMNFFVDISILIKTVIAVVTRKGISHGNEVTMPKFEGNREEEL